MEVTVFGLYEDVLSQNHVLIAGASGSGKSVVIHGVIYNGLVKSNAEVEYIFIDPKRIELSMYKDVAHCIRYASEPEDIVSALRYAMDCTESRYQQMQAEGVRIWFGGDIYVIIDELADLMTTNRKEVQPLIQRLCQIGRAAKVHVIAATQCPLASVIPTPIKVNFDAKIGLRTYTAQDSRNILGVKGCESLPRYGYGYYFTPDERSLVEIPMYQPEVVNEMIQFRTPEPPKSRFSGFLSRLFKTCA